MRRILLSAVLVAISAALFFAFYEGDGSESTQIDPQDTVEGAGADQAGDLPIAEGAPDTDSESALSDGERKNSRELVGTLRVVTGQVGVPSSCAGDEELKVYAWTGAVDPYLETLIPETDPGESLSDGTTLLARTPVDPDGSFRLEVMTDLDEIWLGARGRYTYSEDEQDILLSDGNNEAYLTTLCGACIEGELIGLGEEDPEEVSIILVASSRQAGGISGQISFGSQDSSLLGEDGRFTFTGVRTGQDLELRVEPQEMSPTLEDISSLSGGETRTIQIQLQPGASISGRVLDSDGNPVADARVRTAGGRAIMAIMGWTERTQYTDEDGEFAIVGLPPGEVVIQARKDGFLDSSLERLEFEAGDHLPEFELTLSEGNSLEGTVTWPDGQPVAGAEVEVEFDRSALVGADSINAARGGDGSATTDEQGAFRVGALGHGPFTVSVAHAPTDQRLEDWLATETRLSALVEEADSNEDRDLAWTDQVKGIRPGAPPIQFVLAAPHVIAGLVVDDTGAPVEEYELVMVRLEDSALGPIGVDTIRRQVEDPEGRFLVPGIIPARWNFYAQAEGYSVPTPVLIAVPEPQGSEPVLITLEPASIASGMVFTPPGAPAANAQVMVKMSMAGMLSNISEDHKEPTSQSSVSGEFRLEGLRSGDVELIASAAGYATSEAVKVTLVPGKETPNVQLKLRLGGKITGVLYGKKNGQALPNATIQVLQQANHSTTQITRTDQKGEFFFENLEPGTWQVIGLPNLLAALSDSEDNPGGRAAVLKDMEMAFVELPDGGEEHVILGAPPEDPVQLSGVVRHQNDPVKGATMILFPEGEATMPKIFTTDTSGRYEVQLDKPGYYMCTVQQAFGGSYTENQQNSFRVEIPKTPEHRHDIDLPGAGIRGRVTTTSGAGAGGLPINLSPTYEEGYTTSGDSFACQISTAEDGTYSIDCVRPGNYFLRVGGESMTLRVMNVRNDANKPFAQATRALNIGEDQLLEDVDFVLEEAGSLTVKVLDSSGSPVAGASIFVRDEGGRAVELMSVATTDASGDCFYSGLAEGSYLVSARTLELASVEGTKVQVLAGRTEPVELKLETGTVLVVTTSDGDGDPVSARLRVVDSDGREHASYMSMQTLMNRIGTHGFSPNQQHIGPLPPGRYRVYAFTEDGREEDKPVSLRGQAERTMRIRFR